MSQPSARLTCPMGEATMIGDSRSELHGGGARDRQTERANRHAWGSVRPTAGGDKHGIPGIPQRLLATKFLEGNTDMTKRKKVIMAFITGLGGLLVLGFVLCIFFRIRSYEDMLAYSYMKNMHPIWKDLACRRFGKGDDINEVIAVYPPLWEMKYAPYHRINYEHPASMEGLTLTAKNGKLISAAAGGDCWKFNFFTSPEEDDEHAKAHSAYWENLQLERELYRLHRTILDGNNVFVSEHITEATIPSKSFPEYLETELTVEVSEVISGDVQRGSHVTVLKGNLHVTHLYASRVVFVATTSNKGNYTTVSLNALKIYQSYDDEKKRGLEEKQRAEELQAQKLRAMIVRREEGNAGTPHSTPDRKR
jgi:hypothetical protein